MNYRGIALSGKAGAGKNAFARELAPRLLQHGLWPVEINFADGLKLEMLERFGLKKEDPGGRDKLLEIGHGRRLEDPNYWVKALALRVDSLRPYGCFPLITDMRYLNEYGYASREMFLRVRVDATAMDRGSALSRRGEDREFAYSEHPSETQLDDASFDLRFWNPHGDTGISLAHHAALAAELVAGEVELAA